MENSVNEQQLLSRLAENDRDAFETIYRKYWLDLYDAAFRRLKNAEQAEDIIQDIFASLWQRRNELNINNLPAYLHQAVKFKVYNYISRDKVAEPFYEPYAVIAGYSNSADASLIEKELLGLMEAYIETLPRKRRQIFKMYFQEDLSTREIADQLKISQKTVQNQVGRAINGLKTNLALIAILISTHIRF